MPTIVIILDYTPPLVTANPVGGNYQSLTTVDLTANEPATIYYTTDGTDPIPGNPNTSMGASPLTANLPDQLLVILKFFAQDTAGNESAIQEEVYFIKPLNTTIKTRFGPLVKEDATDKLATVNDVTVTVDGIPVTISGIRPLHNEIYLAASPPNGSEIKVAYCWFDNPTYTILLNDEDYVTNAFFGQNVTDVPYQMVLNSPVIPEPAQVTWEYTAFERRYTAGLNNPDLLLLNEPVHVIRDPITGRPTRSDFVLNQANTIFSYEQIKSNGQPTVLNEGTPIFPLRQDDEPEFGTPVTIPVSSFQSNPDLWKDYDVLIPSGANILAFIKVSPEGLYINLETNNETDGEESLLFPICERFTEVEVEIHDPEDIYEFPPSNCGFIVTNPPPQTSGQLNSCFVLNGAPFYQVHRQVTGTYADTRTVAIVDEESIGVSYEDYRSCVNGFVLNDFSTLLNNFVLPGSYMNDVTISGGTFISGGFLQNWLDCANDEANIMFTTGGLFTTGSFQLSPFQNFFVILP